MIHDYEYLQLHNARLDPNGEIAQPPEPTEFLFYKHVDVHRPTFHYGKWVLYTVDSETSDYFLHFIRGQSMAIDLGISISVPPGYIAVIYGCPHEDFTVSDLMYAHGDLTRLEITVTAKKSTYLFGNIPIAYLRLFKADCFTNFRQVHDPRQLMYAF